LNEIIHLTCEWTITRRRRFKLKVITSKILVLGVASIVVLLASPVFTLAQETGSDDDWKFIGKLYFWGADIGGNTNSGNVIDVSIGDLLDNLTFGFMGGLEARKNKWSFLGDVIYLSESANKKNIALPAPSVPGGVANFDADLDLKSWVVNLIAGYNIWDTDQGMLDVVAGARYTNMAVDFGLELSGTPIKITPSDSENIWDGIIGVKGHLNFSESWYLPYYLDIGAGQSDFTWQAIGGVGYGFNWGAIEVVYRHLEWQLGSDYIVEKLKYSGPGAMVKFYF
jgi:hypothetical protein